MKLPDEDKAVLDIAKEHEKQFSAASRLFDHIVSSLSGGKANGGEHLNRCLSALIIRLLRLHYAAVKLSSLGLASEAKIQIRAMLEICINLYALEQAPSPADYARKWLAWDLHNYLKQVKTELKHHPESQSLFDEHFRIAETVKTEMDAAALQAWQQEHTQKYPEAGDYVKARWKRFLSSGPSMLDLKSLAIAVDTGTGGKARMADTYDYVYPNSSGVAHGSDLASMISFHDETGIVLKLAPSLDSVTTVVVTSTCLLQTGAAIIFRQLKLGGDNFPTETFEIAKSGVPPNDHP